MDPLQLYLIDKDASVNGKKLTLSTTDKDHLADGKQFDVNIDNATEAEFDALPAAGTLLTFVLQP